MLLGGNNLLPLVPQTAPQILGQDRTAEQNGDEIIVTARRVYRHREHKSASRITDPQTGILLPRNFRPRTLTGKQGTVLDDKSRITEYETKIVNGKEVIIRTRSFDEIDELTKIPRIAVVKTFSEDGKLLNSDIEIVGNKLGVDFSKAGSIIGSTLGYRIADGDVLTGSLYSSVLQTIGDNLGDILDGVVGGQSGLR